MAKSKRKQQEEAERQRLDEIEARERGDKVELCIFCRRPAMHDKTHSLHKRMKWEKNFNDIVICLQCHAELHRIAKTRSQRLESVEVALAEESFQKYLKWASKRPPETMYH
ncbi:MAG: hypothetical protein LBK60_10450 [Verrucomicrobiales bacterium]|jgi:hypothetical protein|nr:hypothetical protein [Verrucomicrobiales bacterium]